MTSDTIEGEKTEDFTFGRDEKLKSKKLIDLLFAKGKGFSANPIRMIYMADTTERAKPLVMFSVSKRNFKKAVDRNRIKRQMREVYRLNRDNYFDKADNNAYLIAFIYNAKENIPYKVVEKKLNLTLERLKAGGKTKDVL